MTRKASKERRKTITGGTVTEVSLAAELIAMNVDLLTEILVRLPATSLIRFKCVSKDWLSLISDSQFRRNQSIRNPRPPISGMYFYSHSQLHSVSLRGRQNLPSLSFLVGFPEKSRTTVLHSCNGLLLINNDHFDGHRHRELLIVCNPTTKEYTILPSSHISESWNHGFAYLAFDPSKSPHYKVVYFDFFCFLYVIYCSQNSCWKHLTIERIDCRGVFWNGAIHWFSGENSLLRFDVNAEEIIAMPNPQKPKILPRKKIKYLGESGGRLILIQSKKRFPLGFKILELDKDYCCWRSVKCLVNLRPLIAAFPEIICPHRGFEVLHVSKGDKEKDITLVLAIRGRIISYDLKCKTWNVLRRESDVFGADYTSTLIPFTETLFPV